MSNLPNLEKQKKPISRPRINSSSPNQQNQSNPLILPSQQQQREQHFWSNLKTVATTPLKKYESLQKEIKTSRESLDDFTRLLVEDQKEAERLEKELFLLGQTPTDEEIAASRQLLATQEASVMALRKEHFFFTKEVALLQDAHRVLQHEVMALRGITREVETGRSFALSGISAIIDRLTAPPPSALKASADHLSSSLAALQDAYHQADAQYRMVASEHHRAAAPSDRDGGGGVPSASPSPSSPQPPPRIIPCSPTFSALPPPKGVLVALPGTFAAMRTEYQSKYSAMAEANATPFPATTLVDSPVEYVDQQRKEIFGCSFDKLVLLVTDPKLERLERVNLANIVIFTYYGFTDALTLFMKLAARFLTATAPSTPEYAAAVQRHVLEFLSLWLTVHAKDFKAGELRELFLLFLFNFVQDSNRTNKLLKLLSMESAFGLIEVTPTPLLPPSFDNLQLHGIPPLELARQFTIIAFDLFSKISIRDLLSFPHSSESVARFIASFEHTAHVVQNAILRCNTKKMRVTVMKHVLNTAAECRKLRNYSTLVALMNGLGAPPVVRLKQTVEAFKGKLSVAQKTAYGELCLLATPGGNFRNLRNEVDKSCPPVLPHLGVYQSIIFLVSEGNPDYIHNSLINISKRKLLAGSVSAIHAFQQRPFSLAVVPEIRLLLCLSLSLFF
jgi:hypothetical protein